METTRDLIEKVYDLSRLRIKIGLKRHSPIIFTIGTLFFLVYTLIFGILLVIVFLGIFSQENFQPPSPNRDLLSFGFLVFFATLSSYLITAGATGLRNPFISGRQDAHFFQRVPVESSIMYVSTRIIEPLKIALLFGPMIVVLFSPLMLVLHLPWWRIVGVLIVCFLTYNLCENMAQLAFFALRRFRRKGSWSLIWVEYNSLIGGIFVLGIPVIALLMLQQNILSNFKTLSNYTLFPLINTAVSATGFFFRSGVPLVSWFALLILFLESVVLSCVASIVAVKYKPMEDITEIIPVLSFQATQIEDLIGGKTIESPDLINENIKGTTIISGKSPWRAYLLKDWLAIKRIRMLRIHFYQAPIIVTGLTIAILFIIPKENTLSHTILIIAIYRMADFCMQIMQLEIKDPMKRFPVNKWDMRKSKFLLGLLGTGFYSIPLLVVKGPISLLIIILISGLSIILGKTRLINSKLTRYFILMMIAFLTAPLLLLF
ncbi:MAG: hypothetical protein ACXADY_14525 [Candidatus Hodarchaeales archaeon]